MSIYLVTVALIFAVMLAGIGVERLYRGFAARNPQLGPFRRTDGCGCCAGKSACGAGKSACGDSGRCSG